jgi:aspartyl-tRNA(Asn)/glutamyl-tRNA(Gln) amidotransferase subunit A
LRQSWTAVVRGDTRSDPLRPRIADSVYNPGAISNRFDEPGGQQATMPHDEICYLSAVELLEHFRQKTLSPVEVTEEILGRIHQLNPALTAYITITGDLAVEQARAAEASYWKGDAIKPLAGIPISIKDLTLTRGIRTTRGSLLYENWVPDESAPFFERVIDAGAVILGKTNTPEYGWKGDSGNRITGPTHNPWKHGRTAGGSSGGAGAAVAAGLGPLAQGSDGAGSIRIPSSFCGIFGLKPSYGLVAMYPPSSTGDFSHMGPMTRTVRDAALLLNVTAGSDARDRLSWSSGIDYLEALNGEVAGLRVAWSPDLGYAPVEPEVREAAEAAAHRFVDLGCHVEEVNPGLPDPWDIVDTVWCSAMAGLHAGHLDEVRELIDPGRLAVIEKATEFSAVELLDATLRRNAYYESVRRFMDDYDILLTPTLPCTAFKAGDDHPGAVAGHPTTYLGWTPFTFPFNLTGQPAATVPCGFDTSGLPIGLQIVGRWHDDVTVLRAAAAFEEAAPWAQIRPDDAAIAREAGVDTPLMRS